VAVVLTLVQTKQIRINIHKGNNTKHSKYKYTYYQNTHTYTHPRITKHVKTTTVQVKTNTVQVRKRKAKWIGHILRRNCLLQRVTEGKIQGGIEVTGRQGRKRRKLFDDLQERRGYSHLKEEASNRTM
jgi:hypothetical protein